MFAGGTALAGGPANIGRSKKMLTCPECEYSGEASDFQDLEETAPDLFDVYFCPECDHAFEKE